MKGCLWSIRGENWFCRSIQGWMGDGCGWGGGIGLWRWVGLGRGSVGCNQMDVGGSLDKAGLVECAKRAGQSVA